MSVIKYNICFMKKGTEVLLLNQECPVGWTALEIPGIKIVGPPQEALNYLQEKGHKKVLLSVVRICIMHF